VHAGTDVCIAQTVIERMGTVVMASVNTAMIAMVKSLTLFVEVRLLLVHTHTHTDVQEFYRLLPWVLLLLLLSASPHTTTRTHACTHIPVCISARKYDYGSCRHSYDSHIHVLDLVSGSTSACVYIYSYVARADVHHTVVLTMTLIVIVFPHMYTSEYINVYVYIYTHTHTYGANVMMNVGTATIVTFRSLALFVVV
jgi:hypothetical protein